MTRNSVGEEEKGREVTIVNDEYQGSKDKRSKVTKVAFHQHICMNMYTYIYICTYAKSTVSYVQCSAVV
jgi:hypothetical protein